MEVLVEVLKSANYTSILMRIRNYVRGYLQGCDGQIDDSLIKRRAMHSQRLTVMSHQRRRRRTYCLRSARCSTACSRNRKSTAHVY